MGNAFAVFWTMPLRVVAVNQAALIRRNYRLDCKAVQLKLRHLANRIAAAAGDESYSNLLSGHARRARRIGPSYRRAIGRGQANQTSN